MKNAEDTEAEDFINELKGDDEQEQHDPGYLEDAAAQEEEESDPLTAYTRESMERSQALLESQLGSEGQAWAREHDQLGPAVRENGAGTVNVSKFVRAQAAFIDAQDLYMFTPRTGGREDVQLLVEYSKAQTRYIREMREVLHDLGVL